MPFEFLDTTRFDGGQARSLGRIAGAGRLRRSAVEQIAYLVDTAVRDHPPDFVCVGDVREGITFDHNDVGELARLDGAGILTERARDSRLLP